MLDRLHNVESLWFPRQGFGWKPASVQLLGSHGAQDVLSALGPRFCTLARAVNAETIEQ